MNKTLAFRAILLVLCIVAIALGDDVSTSAPAKATGSESSDRYAVRESVEVRRRTVDVVFVPKSQEAAETNVCRHLSPADLVVTIEGVRHRVSDVEFDTRPLVIAVVLDISGSVGRIFAAEAERAIRRLQTHLEPQDRIALAVTSFDYRVLRMPAPPDGPMEFPKDVELPNSILWAASLTQIRYFSAMEDRSAVLFFTDGADCGPVEIFDRLIEELETRHGPVPPFSSVALSIVQAEGQTASSTDRAEALSRLRHLARVTGGVAYPSTRAIIDESDLVFQRIKNRAAISFVTDHGTDTRTDERTQGKVHVDTAAPCQVEIVPDRQPNDARPWVRSLGRKEDLAETLERLGWPSPKAVPGQAFEATLIAPILATNRSDIRGWATEKPRALVFRGPALVQDLEDFTVWGAYATKGEYVAGGASPPSGIVALRPILVPSPPVATVVHEIRSAADAVMWLLRSPIRPRREIDTWPVVGSAAVVEGKTAIDWQEVLGSTLAFAYADYAKWAGERRSAEIEEELERVLALDPSVPAETRSIVRAAIDAKSRERGLWEEWMFLGGTLGDVELQAVGREIDRRLAQRVIDASLVSKEEAQLASADANTMWERLVAFFPPAVPVRTLTPLVPSYSADLDRIGFWRVVLPMEHMWKRSRPLPQDFLPEVPLATRAIAAAFERRRSALRKPWRIEEVRYANAGPKEVSVEIDLSAADAPENRTSLIAKFSRRLTGEPARFEFKMEHHHFTATR